ncbi:hypothetical protein O181_111370, partial [Austropuccinia psidii MF-1]|nr:hypothetical protein [Austropuccinia psidii MF-1]
MSTISLKHPNKKQSTLTAQAKKHKTISQAIEKSDIHHDIRLDVILEKNWTFFQQILEFLKVVATATDEVQGDSYPSLGLVMPWYQLLRETCQKTKIKVSRESQLFDAADQAYSKLKSYYNIRSNSCAMCLILDPLSKLTWFNQHDSLQEDEINSDSNPIRYKDESLRHLKEVYVEYSSEYAINFSQDPQVSETVSSNMKKLHLFEERMSKRKNKTNEILEYLQTDSPNYSICILELWKSHKNRFPILSKIARDYLGIPATLAPSERVFSEAGNLITNKCTSLS